MKFKKGEKVIYKKHKALNPLGLISTDSEHFVLNKIYEVERIACSVNKTYTLVGTKTYVFESQIKGI